MIAVALALLAALLFGGATPAGKALLGEIDPVLLAGLFYAGAALGTAPWLRRTGSPPERGGRDRADRWRLLGAVLFGGILGPIAFLYGLRLSSAGSVSLWLNLEAVATALLGHFVFREHLGRFGWIGVAGVIASGALLSFGEGWASGLPALLLVGAACSCWGLDNHLTALIDGMSPLRITFWKGTAAGAFNLALALGMGRRLPEVEAVVLALLVGAAAYGASVALYIESARRLGATRAQLVFASAPFFGLVLSVVALGEGISPAQIAAGVLLLGSVGFLFLDRQVHAHFHLHEPLLHTHTHRHDDGHHDHGHDGILGGEAARVRSAGAAALLHSHPHRHESLGHAHPHWPDLHHRHEHGETDEADRHGQGG